MVAVLKTSKYDKPLLYSVTVIGSLASYAKLKKKGFRISSKAPFLLVGTTRFELATSRTPSEIHIISYRAETVHGVARIKEK